MKFNIYTGSAVVLLTALVLTSKLMEVNSFPPPCQNSVQQVYSKTKQKCVNLVGAYCDMIENSESNIRSESFESENGNLNHMECIDGAECKLQVVNYGMNYSLPRCVCHPSFRANRFRKCVLGFGDPCHIDNEELMCDESKHLTCVEGVCRCHQEYVHDYNQSIQQCVGKVGAFCSNKEALDDYNNDPAGVICTSGAICDIQGGERFGNGVCVCGLQYNKTVNGTCEFNQDSSRRRRNGRPGNRTSKEYLIIAAGMTVIILALIACSAWQPKPKPTATISYRRGEQDI